MKGRHSLHPAVQAAQGHRQPLLPECNIARLRAVGASRTKRRCLALGHQQAAVVTRDSCIPAQSGAGAMVSPTAVFAVGCITTVVGGIGLSVQTGVNTTLGSHVGRGVASIVSFIGGLLLLTLFYLLDTYAAQTAIAPTPAQFKGGPMPLPAPATRNSVG